MKINQTQSIMAVITAIIAHNACSACTAPCDFNVTTVSDSPPPGKEVKEVANQSMGQYVNSVVVHHYIQYVNVHNEHPKRQPPYKNRSKFSNRVGRKNHNIHQPGRTNCTQRFHGK